MRRRWSPVPAPPGLPEGLILFDGVCVLCSHWVQFVVARDAAARFRFLAIQEPGGQALAGRLGITPQEPETNAVVLGGRVLFKSDAAIGVLSALPRWGWVRVLRAVPGPLRDWLYDRVAGNRYRLFGRTEHCMLPTPALRARILEAPPRPGA